MTLSKYAFGAVAGTMLLAVSAVGASAAHACVGNVCWVVKERYTYPSESKVIIREETWRPGPEITIREHGPGRGYYNDRGVWTTW